MARDDGPVLEPVLRVGVILPEELEEWNGFEKAGRPGIDLVNCRDCSLRSGTECTPLRRGHVPIELNHRCAHFKPVRRNWK